MVSLREKILLENWNELKKKKMISMDELEEFMDQVGKLLMNYRDAVEKRDSLKLEVKELKSNERNYRRKS